MAFYPWQWFCMSRTNKRRNLTSSQWACIAINSEELVAQLEEEAKARQLANLKQNTNEIEQNTVEKLISPRAANERTAKKLADMLPTNQQYVKEAKRLKRDDIEAFKKVETGEFTIPELKQLEKKERQKARECWLMYRTEKA